MSRIVPTDSPSGNIEIDRISQFLKIPFAVLLSDLTADQKIVYSMIASWHSAECRYSFDYFARALSSSDRTAIRVIDSLIKRGLIEVTKRAGKSSIYRALPLDPCQIVTPDKLSPLTNCHPTPDNLSPLPVTNCHPIRLDIRSEDKIIDPATEAASIVVPLSTAKEQPTPKKQRQKREIDWSQIQGTPEQIEALKRWDTYKRAKRSPVLEMTLQSMIKKHGDRLAENIEHSIANGWSGCFEAKKQSTNGRQSREEAIAIFLDLVRLSRDDVSKAVRQATSDQKIIAAVKKAGIGKGSDWIRTIGQVEGAILQAEQNKFVAAWVTAEGGTNEQRY